MSIPENIENSIPIQRMIEQVSCLAPGTTISLDYAADRFGVARERCECAADVLTWSGLLVYKAPHYSVAHTPLEVI